MADPLSISSAAIGIISLGIQVTDTLYKYYTSVSSQYKDADATKARLESLAGLLKHVHHNLQNRTFPPSSQNLINEIEDTVRQCEGYVQELKQKADTISHAPSGSYRDRIRSAGRRVVYPFRESGLRDLRADINELITQLTLALQQRILVLVQENAGDTKALLEFSRASQTIFQIQSWLKAPDAGPEFDEACRGKLEGTGSWFIKGTSFTTWLQQPASFLWLNGCAGCGKSVLSSTVIRHVRDRGSSPDVGVAFFYFTFSDVNKQSASEMIRALVLQLSCQLGGAPAALTQFYEESQRYGVGPSNDALLKCLRALVRSFRDVYIIIDALDESPRQVHRKAVLSVIHNIRTWSESRLHLLVTSRDELDIRKSLKVAQEENISMKNEGVDADIVSFISQHLSDNGRLQDWKEYSEQINKTLTEKADGVFRWVECQIEMLVDCPQKSQHSLNKHLGSLPQTLDGTYRRMLENIPHGHQKDSRQLLNILCGAFRPLTFLELSDAFAIETGENLGIKPERRLKHVDELQAFLPGFTSIEEHHETKETYVRIAHFSIREYLESERIHDDEKAAFYKVQKEDANALMARICLSFVLDPHIAAIELRVASEQYPFAKYAINSWPDHFEKGSDKAGVGKLITTLLLDRKGAFVNWVSCKETNASFGKAYDLTIQARINYAAKFGRLEALKSLIKESALYDATGKTLADVLNAGRSLDEGAAPEWRVAVCMNDLCEFYDSRGVQRGTPLLVAAGSGHLEIVQFLLDNGADVNVSSFQEQERVLEAALRCGHTEIAKLLLTKGACIKPPGFWYHMLVAMAITRGCTESVRLLLEACSPASFSYDPEGASLRLASMKGNTEMVQIFLDESSEGYTQALEAAAYEGHIKVVLLLLQLADTKAETFDYGESLQAAASRGHREILQLLLRKGADINAKSGGYYGTALHEACNKGHFGLVKFLLHEGADGCSHGAINTTRPLVSSKVHREIVRFLVNTDAGVYAKGESRDTPKLAASYRVCLEIILCSLNSSEMLDDNDKIRHLNEVLRSVLICDLTKAIEWFLSDDFGDKKKRAIGDKPKQNWKPAFYESFLEYIYLK
ncbi:ankyrin repeat-containing protein [Nemania sp. FL0916]|nr:ankyrin repeat-containing protein [Nemania sp. FL0916]